MKYLLLIAFVLLVLWLLRGQRGASPRPKDRASPRPGAAPAPIDIVACDRCGVHLPRAEAVAGRSASYCSDAHRREAEGGSSAP